MGVKDDKIYHECMQLTSQFKFCPNAFRIDMYRGCDFGCKYCFANMEAFGETGTGLSSWRVADFEDVKKKFELALETDKESKSVIVELLRHRVPLHCGGMSDPFQKREWDLGLTGKLIELSNKYDYPICFSTKTAGLPTKYYDMLNPKIHAFQVSIPGYHYDYIKRWETNTPSASRRAELVQLLRKDYGIWCSVRIQPIIDIREAMYLIRDLEDLPSYYSIEHIHVISDSYVALKSLTEYIKETKTENLFTQNGGVLEYRHDIKRRNAEKLIQMANRYGVKVGVADNDLHYMSQSRCCCGIDLIGGAFDNYLKYNSCYMSTGESNIKELWKPQSNIRRHMNVGKGIPTVFVEDVVKKYIHENPDLIPDKYRENVERQLFNNYDRRLF
ncbi:MAG: hypothetical protein J6Y78_15290 [Paludibacteraceae bacterium]|nr:hypothetical protein [Paludibacteraceae bacterium]